MLVLPCRRAVCLAAAAAYTAAFAAVPLEEYAPTGQHTYGKACLLRQPFY